MNRSPPSGSPPLSWRMEGVAAGEGGGGGIGSKVRRTGEFTFRTFTCSIGPTLCHKNFFGKVLSKRIFCTDIVYRSEPPRTKDKGQGQGNKISQRKNAFFSGAGLRPPIAPSVHVENGTCSWATLCRFEGIIEPVVGMLVLMDGAPFPCPKKFFLFYPVLCVGLWILSGDRAGGRRGRGKSVLCPVLMGWEGVSKRDGRRRRMREILAHDGKQC